MNIREDINQYIIKLSSNKQNVIHKIINDELNFKGFDYWKEFKNSLSYEREDIFQELLSNAIKSSEKYKNDINIKFETFLDRSMRNHLRNLKQRVKIKYENNFIFTELTEESINEYDKDTFNNNPDNSIDFNRILDSLDMFKSDKDLIKKLFKENNAQEISKKLNYEWKYRRVKRIIRENFKIVLNINKKDN